jgi:hypothetical protein
VEDLWCFFLSLLDFRWYSVPVYSVYFLYSRWYSVYSVYLFDHKRQSDLAKVQKTIMKVGGKVDDTRYLCCQDTATYFSVIIDTDRSQNPLFRGTECCVVCFIAT